MLMASVRALPVSATTVSMISSWLSSTIRRARRAMAARSFMLVAAQAGCAARALAMAAATSTVLAHTSSPVGSRVTGLRNCRCRRASVEAIGS